MADSSSHNQLIVDQFTRMAAPFAEMPAHSQADSMQLLLETAGVNSEDRVLDVACGPGLVSCAVASIARQVTGIDITPAMIEQARQLQSKRGLSNLAANIDQGNAFDRMEKIRDPSHVRALPLEELKALLTSAGLHHTRTEFYRLDVEADALLAASRTPPAAAEQVRQMLADDIGKDALGVSARRVGQAIYFSFPVAVLAGVLTFIQKAK
jgi:SAM-dependent methyltransferase